jgi:7,8-dihydropterin-6-yl-methyl-4-(beta-D-ribofuranosyl)aminobenzene 5'-phosphate synthase
MPQPKTSDALGECRSVAVTCISEVGWHDTDRVLADIRAAGGSSENQWQKTWDADNAAGSASLVEMVMMDGQIRRILVDCGWNEAYMLQRFAETGVKESLERGEIDLLFLSHEHFDHLWGLQAVLRLCPDITICVPATFSDDALAFILGDRRSPTSSPDAPVIRHTGRLLTTAMGVPTPLYPGCIAVAFNLPILLGVTGEQSLYFRLHDRGTVCVTGCCHQTVTALADYAVANIATEETLYGLYGGLHIAPFGPLTAPQEQMITDMARFGFHKIAPNHCTGPSAIAKMIELGYPIESGSNRPSDTVLGNGARVVFE